MIEAQRDVICDLRYVGKLIDLCCHDQVALRQPVDFMGP